MNEPISHLDMGSSNALAKGINEFEGSVAAVSYVSSFLSVLRRYLFLSSDPLPSLMIR